MLANIPPDDGTRRSRRAPTGRSLARAGCARVRAGCPRRRLSLRRLGCRPPPGPGAPPLWPRPASPDALAMVSRVLDCSKQGGS
ncbi:hypothetical protein KC19_2G193800 [Ceratodon purpureus]|uniref:Uncharacterized protein n=1 Tax=Ceratodon purpureus TaxID=3225 RepID=A0A8T0IVT0_CERPU|nr:hypothetical protein KC19_2G193800 [Ceratodon purpureus]